MILLSALLLAAQPAAKRPRPVRRAPVTLVQPTSDWLKGLWVADLDKGQQMEGCASWMALFFQADGHYLHGDDTGRWELTGTSLVQRTFGVAEGGGDESSLGPDEVSRVERVSANRLRLVRPDGKGTLYLRCPMPETPVAR